MTIGWEKSLCILNAIKNNILNFWVIETIILRFLLSSLEFSWISLNSVFFPVLSPVSIGKFGEVNSPLVKRNPEFSLVGVSETSLLFPLFCPEFTFIRPWTGIMCETPRISHLNEFVDAFSISCKTKSLENTVSVTRYNIVMTNIASSTHWVPFMS
jgi:hypothetical protein